MTATTYARVEPLSGISMPKLWTGAPDRRRAGDAVVLLFLLTQALDGVFTYVGVVTLGAGAEGNPVIAALMATFGYSAALVAAKGVTALAGIALHVRRVHGAVAALAAFYLAVAVIPWMARLLA